MKYIKDILPANNWIMVQSPGNRHCLVYSQDLLDLVEFYNHTTNQHPWLVT